MGEKSSRTIDELERDIARRRVSLMSDVDDLQRVVRQRLDWRRQVHAHPWPLVGAAFAIGFIVGWR
jgi:hypothetical protein